jgi:hypothetical protein
LAAGDARSNNAQQAAGEQICSGGCLKEDALAPTGFSLGHSIATIEIAL